MYKTTACELYVKMCVWSTLSWVNSWSLIFASLIVDEWILAVQWTDWRNALNRLWPLDELIDCNCEMVRSFIYINWLFYSAIIVTIIKMCRNTLRMNYIHANFSPSSAMHHTVNYKFPVSREKKKIPNNWDNYKLNIAL